MLDAYLQGPSGQQDVPRYAVGDEVIVNISQQGEDAELRRGRRSLSGAGARRAPRPVRGRGDAGRWLARRPLADRPRPDARRHHPDRRAAAAGGLEPGAPRGRLGHARHARHVPADRRRPPDDDRGRRRHVHLPRPDGAARGRLQRARPVHRAPGLGRPRLPPDRRPARARSGRAPARGGDLRRPRDPRRRDGHPGGDGPRAVRGRSARDADGRCSGGR